MANEIGGSGGSGVVILRYTSPTQLWSGGVVTQVGNDWVHRFTRNGQLYSGPIVPDQSGNDNFWTPNNISLTAGPTYDVMRDVPTLTDINTANYAVMNPLTPVKSTLLDGNLRTNGGDRYSISTIGVTSGKWYAEMTVITVGTESSCGIATQPDSSGPYVGNNAVSWGYYSNDGNKYTNATPTAYGATYTTGDVIGIAFDADNGTLTFYKNNTSQGTAFTGLTSGPYYFAMSGRSTGTANNCSINFGQQPFAYTPPTGFNSLNTYNLGSPQVLRPNQQFDMNAYTGTGSTQSISDAGGFVPGLVWIKSRSDATSHSLYDIVRGPLQTLSTDSPNMEMNITGSLTSFNSTGFTLGAATQVNTLNSTYIGWEWRGGDSTAMNTAGTITSMVSANPGAGFSVVAFSNIASGQSTVGHGLAAVPQLIIAKSRSASSAWTVYSSLTGINQYLSISGTGAAVTQANVWGSAAPDQNVFGFNTNNQPGGQSTIAYCFAPVAGYSALGSYTGNGSSDGPFIYTGFRPKWIMIKAADRSPTNWDMTDTARSGFNPTSASLDANLPDMEYAGYPKDILSNGFKIRENNQDNNNTGSTYIYMAFAESPLQYSLAR